jgi:hypothetical protein
LAQKSELDLAVTRLNQALEQDPLPPNPHRGWPNF